MLPLRLEGRGKVMFSQVSVHRGAVQDRGTPSLPRMKMDVWRGWYASTIPTGRLSCIVDVFRRSFFSPRSKI